MKVVRLAAAMTIAATAVLATTTPALATPSCAKTVCLWSGDSYTGTRVDVDIQWKRCYTAAELGLTEIRSAIVNSGPLTVSFYYDSAECRGSSMWLWDGDEETSFHAPTDSVLMWLSRI